MNLAFGSIVALFLPGFAWSFVILGSKDVWTLERMMISIGLSIAIVPLTLLLLSFLGVGITFLSVILVIFALVVLAVALRLVGDRILRGSSGNAA